MARSLDLTITAEPGGTILNRRFTRFVSDLTDLRPVLEEVVDALIETFRDAFRTEGSSSGSSWAPLSEAYRRAKARRYPGRTILIRRGTLYSSLVEGGAGGIREVRSKYAAIGTAVPYARYHQSGTSRMPARPIIRVSAEDRNEITRIVHRYLVKSAAGRLR